MDKMSKRFLSIGSISLLLLTAVLFLPGDSRLKQTPPAPNGFDWPQWRGPNRDGLSAETGLADQWPEAGPEVLWRTSVGEGYSGIAVSGSRIFSMWDEGTSQFLVCMNAANGKEIWRYKVGEGYKDGWGNGPRSTPMVNGHVVYAASAHAQLHAVNASDGKFLWMHDLPSEFGGRIPDHGYSSTPLVEGEALFVEVGGREGYSFAAFNKLNGNIIWHALTDEPSYSSPIAVTIGGTRQIVFLSAAGLFSVSPEDGSLLWRYDWEARCPATKFPTNSATPIFMSPDKIFISGGYGTIVGAAVVRVKKTGGTFAAEELWKSQVMKNVINASVLYQNFVYGFDNTLLKCVDPLTGKEKWSTRGYQKGSMIAADGHLFVLGERGRLALLEANPENYREVASAQLLDGVTWTSPSLADGRIYLRSQAEMICIDVAGGIPRP